MATQSISVGVLGHSGFIGSHVKKTLHAREIPTVLLSRLTPDASDNRLLIDELANCDVVLNCAGAAIASATKRSQLQFENVELPVRLFDLCETAQVSRMVHLSSAAVQGRREVLDETYEYEPFSHYSRSKIEAERALLLQAAQSPVELSIYRPTSVQGAERPMTRRLARLARFPLLPIIGTGDEPIPFALVENVAKCAVDMALADNLVPLALHPWEGITQRDFFELFGQRSPVATGRTIGAGLNRSFGFVARHLRILEPYARRFELLTIGQGQDAVALHLAGISNSVSPDDYRAMLTAL